MNYQNYHFRDFMLDEGFQKWVLEPDFQADAFWPNWIRRHPEKEEEIRKARTAVLELHLAGTRKEQGAARKPQGVRVFDEETECQQVTWNLISQAIVQQEAETGATAAPPAIQVIPLWGHTWTRVAAAVLLVIGLGWLFWLRPADTPEVVAYQTAFGQTRQLALPDGSVVFLNANSRLTLARRWAEGEDREVTLAGEAFFAVRPMPRPRPFRVELSGGGRVEVLGTEFTVTNRPLMTRVVLNLGRVQVGLTAAEPTGMVPGEVVEIDRNQRRLTKRKVTQPENYSAFVQNRIEFNDSPLAEVARVLEDNYGYKVKFVPAALAQKRFTSSNPGDRVDLLLFTIEKSFNLQVRRKGRHITFQLK
jgi:ferric-dicitrate binding protein FerR (iron transport regulator)